MPVQRKRSAQGTNTTSPGNDQSLLRSAARVDTKVSLISLLNSFLKGLEAIFHIGPIACRIYEGIGFRIQAFVFRLHPVIAAVGAEEDVARQSLEHLEG